MKRSALEPLEQNRSASPGEAITREVEADENAGTTNHCTPLATTKSAPVSTAKRARTTAGTASGRNPAHFKWERVTLDDDVDEDDIPAARWGAASCLIEQGSKVSRPSTRTCMYKKRTQQF